MLWSAMKIALLVYLGLMALMYFTQSKLIFLPEIDRSHAASPSDIGLSFAPLKLATADGESLDGWFLPGKEKHQARGLVLFFHGNAGNIAHRLDYLRMFHDMGLATLIIDYRGYGRSSGSPSEAGTYLDANAAWHHATQALGFPAERIVLFGESLGGAVAANHAAQLATQHRPAALVLASTFTSVPDLGAELYPLLPIRLLARIRYNTLERLAQINCPIIGDPQPQRRHHSFCPRPATVRGRPPAQAISSDRRRSQRRLCLCPRRMGARAGRLSQTGTALIR